jgi:rhodanese-related sulfurtransferase
MVPYDDDFEKIRLEKLILIGNIMLKTIPALLPEIRAKLNCVSAAEATRLSQKFNGVIIDVREPGEYAKKSADNTINIPRGVLEMKVLELYPDAEQAIFIHCASGVRASFAGEQLTRIGYQNVWVITCNLADVCLAN